MFQRFNSPHVPITTKHLSIKNYCSQFGFLSTNTNVFFPFFFFFLWKRNHEDRKAIKFEINFNSLFAKRFSKANEPRTQRLFMRFFLGTSTLDAKIANSTLYSKSRQQCDITTNENDSQLTVRSHNEDWAYLEMFVVCYHPCRRPLAKRLRYDKFLGDGWSAVCACLSPPVVDGFRLRWVWFSPSFGIALAAG